jgi:hypothetical protein
MARRPQLAARLARVEAALKVPLWVFRLLSGRTASVPARDVLDVLAEAMRIVHDPDGDHPPLSKQLLVLAEADAEAEKSMLGRAALQLARRAREAREP